MPRSPTNQDWITLSEASRVLGVSPATLRRWSDAGRLRVFTTPGGHRRFSRSSLERLLPADRSRRPSIVAGGVTATRMERAYRDVRHEVAPDLPWVLNLSDEHRILFRERGQTMAESLLQFLDAAQPETAQHHFAEAMAAAEELRGGCRRTRPVAQPDRRGLSSLPCAVPPGARPDGTPAGFR